MAKIYMRVHGWAVVLAFAAGLIFSTAAPGRAGELEPRRQIIADMLPLTITDSGSSWYLAESITTTGDGITVAADHVTIDLMGYMLEGGTGVGIRDDNLAGFTRIGTTIMNGSVIGWSSHGIALGIVSRVINVTAETNGGNGIQVGSNGRFIDCTANSNTGHGFDAGSNAYIRGCLANSNMENGFLTESDSYVINTMALANHRNGIRLGGSCVVLDSNWQFNDQNLFYGGAGIWVLGTDNRIDGNNFDGNNIGIHVDGNDNLIVRNTLVHSNGNVYDVDPGATGNFIPNFTIGTAGAPGPWDNLCADSSCP